MYSRWIDVYFTEQERFFIVDWIEAVGSNHTSTEFFANRIGWQTVHVHFNISSYFLI